MTIVKDTPIVHDRPMTMEAILARDQRTTSHRVLDHRANQDGVITMTAAAVTTKRRKPSPDANPRYAGVIGPRIDSNDHAQRYLERDSYLVPALYDDRGIRSRHHAAITATTWLSKSKYYLTSDDLGSRDCLRNRVASFCHSPLSFLGSSCKLSN